MPRNKINRQISVEIEEFYFKPMNESIYDLDIIELESDEWEALRLSRIEGFYQSDAAELMSVSRQTYARIINSAIDKIAIAIIEKKVLHVLPNKKAGNAGF